jgi:hypothetical protein
VAATQARATLTGQMTVLGATPVPWAAGRLPDGFDG